MRPVRIIAALVFAATVGTLTLLAAPAWAAPTTPPANVHVSPSSIAAGDTVTLSGSVGPDSAGSECATRVTLISKAFVHTYDFAEHPRADPVPWRQSAPGRLARRMALHTSPCQC